MRLLRGLIGLLLLAGCADNSVTSELQKLDLMKYNVPISILAPDSATVQTMDLVVQKDISIKGGDDFYIQLFMSDATEINSVKVATKLKNEIKKSAYFSKIIREDESGFIFENSLDSLHKTYDFRHIRIQGDKEFEFRTGLIGSFTLAQAEIMYEAVQGK